MDNLKQDIFNLRVVDMHNHLDVDPSNESVVAQNFWDIGEYFWVRRHLWSAGYPVNAADMPFDKRAEAYIKALNRASNTVWVRALKQGIRDLYGMELTDVKSVYALEEIISSRKNIPNYGKEIAEKAKLDCFIVNGDGSKKFGELSGLAVHVESIDKKIKEWSEGILKGDNVLEDIETFFALLKDKKVPGVRTTINRMIGFTYREKLIFDNMSYDDAQIAVLHYVSQMCEKYNIFIQFFLGVANDISNIPGPYSDGDGVAKLYGIFEKYNCIFSLITASQAQNIEVVNAANVFSNVQVDGLWWYNFRPSSYREALEIRMEELPSVRSSIIASDAYVIEWCYIKMNLVKQTLYEFMKNEIEKGHIDREMAINVASDWLSGSAKELLEGRM